MECGCQGGVLPGAARVTRAHVGRNPPTRPCRRSQTERRLVAALTVEDVDTSYELARTRPIAVKQRRRSRGWFIRRLLAVADVVAVVLAFAIAELLLRPNGVNPGTELFVLTLPLWVVGAKLFGLYDRDEERPVHSTADELGGIFHLVTTAVWLYASLAWVTGLAEPNVPRLTVFWIAAITTIACCRAAARGFARRQAWYRQNTVIIGAGDIGQLIARKVVQHPEYGLELVGFVDAEPKAERHGFDRLRMLGLLDSITEIVEQHDVDRVVVAYSRDRHEDLIKLIRVLRTLPVQIDVAPRLFDAITPRVSVHTIEGFPLFGLTPARIPRSSRFLKRTIDVVGASFLLLLTLPLMGLIALFVRLDSSGPVFFRQTRLGMDEKEFSIFKFRTMGNETDDDPHRAYIREIMDPGAAPGPQSLFKLERSDSVTRVGRWLRRTSLDEWPQLLNVVRGEMSLVGPRPCIPYETEFFAPHHFDRFLVPSGITGLWQVEARAHSTFAEALDLDVAYARGWSLALDLRLLVRTPLLMFRRKNTD
jgi:exopolysaccharide biosynthesis polyprenyl glycosylphosphotransferase